jgi:hypothetical protein
MNRRMCHRALVAALVVATVTGGSTAAAADEADRLTGEALAERRALLSGSPDRVGDLRAIATAHLDLAEVGRAVPVG